MDKKKAEDEAVKKVKAYQEAKELLSGLTSLNKVRVLDQIYLPKLSSVK